jgi:uncharacterized protein
MSSVALDAMLTASPGVCGGRIRIDGTRITVHRIAALYKQGQTPEEITQTYGHLSLSQVYAALAYYHANRAEIESELTDIRTKDDILDALSELRPRLAAFGVEKIGLFGSFVRGQQRPESDIDLLVKFAPEKKTFDAFMELSLFLEELLQRRVELVTTEALSPYIGPHVLEEVEYAA